MATAGRGLLSFLDDENYGAYERVGISIVVLVLEHLCSRERRLHYDDRNNRVHAFVATLDDVSCCVDV